MPEPKENRSCRQCSVRIRPESPVLCVSCGLHSGPDDYDSAAQLIREWADKRKVLHGMSFEVAELFELCAEDIARG